MSHNAHLYSSTILVLEKIKYSYFHLTLEYTFYFEAFEIEYPADVKPV